MLGGGVVLGEFLRILSLCGTQYELKCTIYSYRVPTTEFQLKYKSFWTLTL